MAESAPAAGRSRTSNGKLAYLYTVEPPNNGQVGT